MLTNNAYAQINYRKEANIHDKKVYVMHLNNFVKGLVLCRVSDSFLRMVEQ